MKFNAAIDAYIADQRAYGRINSHATERTYRSILDRHGDDLSNRDPSYVGREDVKRTLRRWTNPNSQRTARSILVSFYDWAMEEGHRKDNPARQTRRPKKRPTSVYRLTRSEAHAMLSAVRGTRERRAIHIGLIAGLRNAELRGLQGLHFQVRPGFIWISAAIAKGGRERWVPVLPDLEPVAEDVIRHVGEREYVLPAQRWRDPGANLERIDLRLRPSSSQALRTLVMDVATRAGIRTHVHPHLMRHAFGDHVARFAGLRVAQALLGHVSVDTTESTYTGRVTLDELVAATVGLSYGPRTEVLPVLVPVHDKQGNVVAEARVDADTAEWASDCRWHLSKDGYVKFCRRIDGRLCHYFLHRMVMGVGPGDKCLVDHENGNPLDNQRANLRIADHTLNAQNRQGANKGSASRFRGVSREGDKWRAQVWVDGTNHRLGRFDSEEEAAAAATHFRADHHPFSIDATRTYVLPLALAGAEAREAPTGIEPVFTALQAAA